VIGQSIRYCAADSHHQEKGTPAPTAALSCALHMANLTPSSGKTFVVEHLDPELEEWSSLEYYSIASECHDSGAKFLLSSVPESLKLPGRLQQAKALAVETRGIEEIYPSQKDRICLLDPAASKDLSPADGDTFDIFLFGGILGTSAVTHIPK
jgi:ribosome biogenesis SPOUT family RNA methylase Rps3